MKIDKNNTFLFHNVDRHGLIFNHVRDMIVGEFTLLIEFKPDIEHIREKLNTEPNYQQCIVGKNGKHTGLFICAYDIDGEPHLNLEYQWWQNPLWEQNQNPEEDEFKNVIVPIKVDVDSTYRVIVQKTKREISVECNLNKKSLEFDSIIDYSNSLMWLGAANRLNDTPDIEDPYNNIFTGEILKMHLQEKSIEHEHIKLFFDDYNKFLDLKLDVKKNKVFFTSDFSNITPYKILDQSGNGNHPIIFRLEWLL